MYMLHVIKIYVVEYVMDVIVMTRNEVAMNVLVLIPYSFHSLCLLTHIRVRK